jgi:hypothetical protein
MTEENRKNATGRAKVSFSSIPPVALVFMGEVMERGRNKYGKFNWRAGGANSDVYHDAIARHLIAWADGEDIDEDGLPHLAHVMACCAIIMDAGEYGALEDERQGTNITTSVMHNLQLLKNGGYESLVEDEETAGTLDELPVEPPIRKIVEVEEDDQFTLPNIVRTWGDRT